MLEKDTKISKFRLCHEKLSSFFDVKNNLCYCKDVWRLFIDFNETSLKAVLLYNENVKPSIPIAHAVNMTETYIAMKTCLKAINYSKHNWKFAQIQKLYHYLLGCSYKLY